MTFEVITFDELLEYGKNYLKERNYKPTGSRWSFEYRGEPITHETDELFIILTREGYQNITLGDVLMINAQGEMNPCKIDNFKETYEKVEEND